MHIKIAGPEHQTQGRHSVTAYLCSGRATNDVRQSRTAPGHIEEVSYFASITISKLPKGIKE